jgi:hypothetical protein
MPIPRIAIGSTSDVDLIWNSDGMKEEINRLTFRGLTAASIFLANRVKELVSVPAPRRWVKPRRGGPRYLVATTRATPGAPPRKLNGRLRADVTYDVAQDGQSSRVGVNTKYGRRLEATGHLYLTVALARFQADLAAIIASPPPF